MSQGSYQQMPSAEKIAKVEALKGRIESSEALLLAEYRGLTVHDATELRRSLQDEARFSVVKNTLMQRAAGEAGIDELEALLIGPTAVAFVRGDVVATAKRIVDAAKRFPALVIKGAYMEGRVLDAAEAQALATLESREAMLSRIAGLMKAEMSRAASMLQQLQSRFVGLLEAYRDKLPGEAVETEAAGATETDETPHAETSPGETEEAPTAETTAEADTAEPASQQEPAEEPEAANGSHETGATEPNESATTGDEPDRAPDE
jgi:large subunit ribosomal protein L10